MSAAEAWRLCYKAQDILLNRYVAVKVLRQQFVHDEEFIRRFRRKPSLLRPYLILMWSVFMMLARRMRCITL